MAEKSKKTKNKKRISELINGDILGDDFFRREAKLLSLIFIMILFYISNRYECQQKLLEINDLKQKLTDIKYDALTRSSELMERSRQSKIEDFIENGDSELETATTPPYLIK